jgi:hypothetical protein
MDVSMESPPDKIQISLSIAECKFPAPYNCPHCHKEIPSVQFHDGDIVNFEIKDPLDYAFYLAIIFGQCPHCSKPLTALEISHISQPLPGYYFADDNCYTSESARPYTISGAGFEWSITRHHNVTGLFFTAGEENRIPRQLTSPDVYPWLNFHTIGPSAFAGCENTMDRAREIFCDLKPKILLLDWSNAD